MPISEKRSATDGVVVPFKKPRTEIGHYAGDKQESLVCSFKLIFVLVFMSFTCIMFKHVGVGSPLRHVNIEG